MTIDGPVGSGKGTISRLLAHKLGWHLLDSGSLYRLTALTAIQKNVALDNEKELANIAASLNVEFIVPYENGPLRILLDGQRVEQVIRQEKVGLDASVVAGIASVRKQLLDRQRAFAAAPGLVADGRDMGTVVFPDAAAKIFLTADAKERARRRYQQLQKQNNDVSIERVLLDIKARDKRDTERVMAPLCPSKDAIVIDSTSLSIQEVLDNIIAILSGERII